MSKLFTTKRIVRAGLIGGIYVALSLIVFPVASGAIQFRPSEALTVLPLIFPEAVLALFIGCALSNLITGCAVFDILFGSLITLFAGVFTFCAGKLIKNTAVKVVVGGLFPVLMNALLLPLIWVWCYGALEYMYIIQALFLILSQSVSVYALGVPLYISTKKLKDKLKI